MVAWLAQGTVIFENSASGGNICKNQVSVANYAPTGTYTVVLLWPPGTSPVRQARLTQIALYGRATGGATVVAQPPEFVNNTGNLIPPETPPVQATGWDGNLIVVNPEPGTMAIAGMGAAALVLLCRRKLSDQGFFAALRICWRSYQRYAAFRTARSSALAEEFKIQIVRKLPGIIFGNSRSSGLK